jgi:hypothetical protein
VTLAGLPLAQLGTIFAAAGAAIAALYLLKLRRRAVAVPFSPLWDRILRDREATTLLSRIKRVLSLLLQLVLLALLVVALGDPRMAASATTGREVVVLLDASASMQATDVAPDRLSAAKDEVRKMVRGLGPSDRMLVARMDAAVTPLGPMSADPSVLEREVDAVTASDAPADFPRALRFATDVLRTAERGEIVVVSDGALGEASDAAGPVHLGRARLEYVRVGREARNVAITQMAVRRYPLDKNRYEVMLELYDAGPEPADVELRLLGDGALVDLARVHLGPGERVPRFYPQLSGASRTLEAHIARVDGGVDALAVDDHAYALLPDRRRTRVLIVGGAKNTYLSAALLLDEYLDVTEVDAAGSAEALARGGWDAVIFDGVTPAAPPGAHALYLDPTGPGSPVRVDRELKTPGFDRIDRKHPIVHWLALDDVNVSRGHRLVAEPGDRVVGAAEDGAAPLLVAGTRGGYKFVALGFDVRDSDLPLRVAWPLFVLDCIDWFTGEETAYLSGYRTGDVWRIPVVGTPEYVTVKRPDGSQQRAAVHEGRAVIPGDRTGFYEILGGAGAEDRPIHFAANLLDAGESAIAPRDQLAAGGAAATPPAPFRAGLRRDVWVYLLLVALLLTALEWGTYHRRVTV